VLKQGLS